MQANVLFINPPEIMTDQGTFKLSEVKGHICKGAVIDTETMRVVKTDNNVDQDCQNGVCPVR